MSADCFNPQFTSELHSVNLKLSKTFKHGCEISVKDRHLLKSYIRINLLSESACARKYSQRHCKIRGICA